MKRIHGAVASAVAAILMILGLCLVGGNAAAVPNNVDGDDCSWLFPGSVEIPKDDMTWSGGDGEAFVTVWTVDVKWFVSGFVVKGGNGYNTFSAGDANNMVAPDNASGNPADVSHWFACGMTEEEETTETTTTTTVETTTETTETTTSETTETTTSETTTSETTETTTSDTTTSETTSETTPETTTSESTSETTTSDTTSETTPPVVTTTTDSAPPVTTTTNNVVAYPESNPEDLAYTGASVLWVLLVGVCLLAAGVVAVLVTRRRKQ